MVRLSLVAACIVHYTEASSSSSSIIRMPRGNMNFPIQFIAAEGNGTFGGFATLNFYGRMFQYEPPTFDDFPPDDATITQARGILIGEPPLRIDFVREHTVLNSSSATENDFRIVLPGGCGSAMSRDVQSFLLTPVSETEDIFVLNPTNASQYAFEGQIFYTNMTRGVLVSLWPIHAAVRVSSGSSSVLTPEEYMPFGLAMMDFDTLFLPRHLRPDIVRSLDELGIDHSNTTGIGRFSNSFEIYNMDITRLAAALPSIEVLISTDTGEIVQIARIDPIDYIAGTDDPTTFRVQFGSGLACFSITPRFYKNLVIHFDTQNGRVGFADPLVELL